MSPSTAQDNRFGREGQRHRFTARRVSVRNVSRPAEHITRVTLGGPDLADFASIGPADHVRVCFPDPSTGELHGPSAAGPDEDGLVPAEGPVIARDFTPLSPRGEGADRLVDIDFYQHDDPGPAAAWSGRAEVGGELILVGPRGSRRAPQGASRILLVVDATALPSASRWVEDAAPGASVSIVSREDPDWVAAYLSSRGLQGRAHIVPTTDEVEALRVVGIDDGTYVFAAGEAAALIPVRRHLKYELELPRSQYTVSGYWKYGAMAFDHHAPVDPDDPDEPEDRGRPGRSVARG